MHGADQIASFACMYDNHGLCHNPRCQCNCHPHNQKKEEPVTQSVPFHKTALLGLVKAHPESAVRVLEELIGGLPDSLDYADLSSTTVAEELLVSLTKPVTVVLGGPFIVGGAAVPRVLHHLAQDHNGDPICNCGWPPNNANTREEARLEIRQHIADKKEQALVDRTGPH
jgi:hypothetical protein